MVRDLFQIPNYIHGEYRTSATSKKLYDFDGNEFAEIYSATDANIRQIKRSLVQLRRELRNIPIEKIISVIKRSSDHYLTDRQDIETISRLTGSPMSFLLASVKQRKEWCKKIDDFMKMCFGEENYDAVPIHHNGNTFGIRKYYPRGPIIALLPQNSDEESLYVIVQILLSKNPAIIRASSEGVSNYSSIKYIEALCKAIDDEKDPSLQALKRAISIINLFGLKDKKETIHKLAIDEGTYLLFGSNETLRSIEMELQKTKPKHIIKMGTGFSVAFVAKDADIGKSAREICEAASVNNGNECIATNIAYIETSIYNQFLKSIKALEEEYNGSDPLRQESKIGKIHPKNTGSVLAKLKEIGKHTHLRRTGDFVHLSIIVLDSHHHMQEYPAPILALRKVQDKEDFIRQFNQDLERNEMKRNLVTSIFTKNTTLFEDLCRTINSHTVKLNRGTDKMNMLLEHQGHYLVKEFLDSKIIETG